MMNDDELHDPHMAQRIPPPPQRPQQPQMGQGQSRVRSEDMPQQRPVQQAQARTPGPSMRQIFANLQPYAAKVLGWAFILWSGGASVFVVRQYMVFLTDIAMLQTGVGVIVAAFLTLGQAILISQETQHSIDGYWVLVAVDAFLTAQMNHQFSVILIEKVFLAPFIMTGLITYIGMIMVFHKSRLISIVTSLGMFFVTMGAVLGAKAWGNPLAVDYTIYSIDIIGGIWTSQLGERFAFGKRNR